jgi:DNA helicase-2/ATP-dependent DNA helicase PcrA
MESYKRQLCTYAHILERRHGKRVDRLLLYWTSEPRKEDALMELPYSPELVEAAGGYFDQVVAKIQDKDFDVRRAPEAKICRECDFRRYCHNEGTIQLREEE